MKQKSLLRGVGILVMALLFSTTVMAQGVNFSGTWKLNPSKSKLNEQFSMAPKEMVITQEGNSLSVMRHSVFQEQEFTISDKFTLDGNECINEGWQESQKKSTAVWSDDKKSLTVKTKIPMENSGEMSISETYKLAEGSLSVETSSSSDWGTSNETYVFDKK